MVELLDELLLIVSVPLAVPVVVGSKIRVTFSVCPGFSFAGRLTAEAENPLPVTAIEFTVTAAVPLEVRVMLCVVELLITIAPKEMVVAFTLSAGVPAFNCNETLFEMLPVVAVNVADWELLTEATFAVKAAFVAAAGTVTEPGTVTALLLLARPTLKPPVGAEPDRLTVQTSESDPVIDVLLQDTPLTVGATVVPVPLRLTIAGDALLEIVNCPVDEPAAEGSNWTERTAACPGFRVAGKFPPETEKPVPEIESELMVTAAVPLEVTVTDLDTAVPT